MVSLIVKVTEYVPTSVEPEQLMVIPVEPPVMQPEVGPPELTMNIQDTDPEKVVGVLVVVGVTTVAPAPS